jgi:hypothetical protein
MYQFLFFYGFILHTSFTVDETMKDSYSSSRILYIFRPEGGAA